MNFIQPSIDPVIFSFSFIDIRWYSLAYIFGLLFGLMLIKRLNKINGDLIKINQLDNFFIWAVIGIILGGRIGYVILYQINEFLNNPLYIFEIWNGGMSFHGGLIGVIVFTIFYAKKNNLNKFIFLDLISASAPIGIFLGRISNFINSELYGKQTDVFWSVIFPKIDDVGRHPSQIYEALLEGVVLFVILFLLIKKNYLLRPGLISAFFLIFYSIFRFISEFFRVPDEQLGFIYLNLTMGQIISLFFLIFGFYLFLVKKNEN